MPRHSASSHHARPHDRPDGRRARRSRHVTGFGAVGAVLLLGVALGAPRSASAHEGHPEIRTVAEAMAERAAELRAARAKLPKDLWQTLEYPFDAPHRTVVDFFPGTMAADEGVDLGYQSLEMRRATHGMLRAALSPEGYLTATSIMALEDELRATGAWAGIRISDNYGVHLFGDPAGDVPWGWKFEGHHLSLNVTLAGGAVRTTPMFLGSNPAEVRVGPKAGLRVLAPLQDAGFAFLGSLTDAQRTAATQLTDVANEYIPRGGARTSAGAAGVAAADLTEAQRAALLAIVGAYAALLRPELAQAELDRVVAAGVERLRFEWRGAADRGERHYFRIDGPTVGIEFEAVIEDPAQGANHIHTIWHDPERDFGRDLLREHQAREHGGG